MPSLTDSTIRQALKRVETQRKQENLADGEGRGTGRLILVLKPMPKRVTADWMAQQWRDGKRAKKKLGAYPSMSLAQAREIFKRDFADVIQKRRSIKIATDTRPGTVADLFEATSHRSRRRASPPGRRRKRPSTRSPTRSDATASPAKSNPKRLSSSSGQSTSAERDLWRTMFGPISTPLTAGA
jgi:hypothetical protein